MATADDPQASMLQQLPLLLSIFWTAPPSNANFQGAREVFRPPLVESSTTDTCPRPGMTNVSSQRGGHMYGRSKDRIHQPASTLPSPQGFGHSIYQQTPGSSRRHSFTISINSEANAETEGDFLLPPPIIQSSAHILTELAES